MEQRRLIKKGETMLQFRDYSPIIHAFVAFLDANYDKIDLYDKNRIIAALMAALRNITDRPVDMVSEAVMINCQQKGIDPFDLLWNKRNVLGRDKSGKSLLAWEHTTPLSELRDSLVECKSEQEVRKVLENYSGVCWIMRDENNILNERGFRSKRPNGWEAAYEACGIKVIYKSKK